MITLTEAQIAIALFDFLITSAERVAEKIAEARKAGVITVEEQQERVNKIDSIRTKVGLPAPGA